MSRSPGAPGGALRIVRLAGGPAAACEAVLRALPDWFGDEGALAEYVRRIRSLPTVAALDGDRVIGFASIERHFARAAEIHCMGVAPEAHGRGVGRALVMEVESWAAAWGVRHLQVKTLGPSVRDPNYARTRAFYRAVGFDPLEEMSTLWDHWPCLVLVKQVVPEERPIDRRFAP